MHDTAHRIGGLVMDTYLPASPARILEIGALDVNGTLRDHSPRNAEYVGLDFEAGKGVDQVITGLDDWNVPDGHFDLVMASSVFEHDPTYWKTFIAMCRKAKPGGHVYVSAPSNGTIHRYPKDYWRFYPDAGLALEQIAREEGIELTLIESFVAEREADNWNDFCAVFCVGNSAQEINRDFVYKKVPSHNVITWRSSLVINSLDDPEDARLLRRSREEGHALRLEVEKMREELDEFKGRERIIIEETESSRLEVEKLKAKIDEIERDNVILSSQLEELSEKGVVAEQRLQDRFREIAALTQLMQDRDQAVAAEYARAEWLRQVLLVLTRGYTRSVKGRLGLILPVWFSKRRHKALLRKQGLFDATDYGSVNPDVVQKGADPLRHYINRGMAEGRSRGRFGGRGY